MKSELSHIQNEIECSKYILNLKYDWDDDGAKPISKEIYDSAINFLIDYSEYILKNYSVVIGGIEINPCCDNSIDLSFETGKGRMLVNIRKEADIMIAAFYGDDGKNENDQIKGKTTANGVREGIARWMSEHLINDN